ncbi:MAG: cytochrome c oxidase subunit 3 [Endozoicomonas sp.]
MATEGTYYVPAQSKWPIIASIGLFLTLAGAGMMMNDMSTGVKDSTSHYVFYAGGLLMAWMLFGWFGNVISESRAGLYSEQMDRTFRWGMFWFIFSEVMFFAALFGTLFYVRHFAVPWLAGEGDGVTTHQFLWPDFVADWPLLVNPDNDLFVGATNVVDPFHLPLINTLFLVASSITLTFSHHALRVNDRYKTKLWLIGTLVLGAAFLVLQVEEYIEAYTQLGLTLSAGIYGSTFFLLTGFHGAHVTLGAIMLAVMLYRVYQGDFDAENHFAFEASSWYWHFVDVVWVGLFLFVYIF